MNRIEEPAREGFLYHIWLRRKFPPSLLTIDGRKVIVLEKGVRNYDAGPDFLNALVKLDGQLLRGDIEIHPVAGDWYVHGHQNDPRYNRVILHVVTMNCPPAFKTRCQDGNLVPTLNLDDFLELPAEQLEKEEPAQAGDMPENRRCQLARENERFIQQVLESAGRQRLDLKTAGFTEKRATDSWDQLFYSAILEALGYSKNQVPFRNLAQKLPVETVWDLVWNDPLNSALLKCEAYLFGVAGLLPSQVRLASEKFSFEEKKYLDGLECYWANFPLKEKIDPLKPENWLFFRLRPQNFPTRRLAAAAVLVLRFMSDGFVDYFRRIFDDCQPDEKLLNKELLASLTVTADRFWLTHYSFDAPVEYQNSRQQHNLIIGSERARDILVNVIFPGLISCSQESGDHRLLVRLKQTLSYLPLLSDNEITRAVRSQIFGAPSAGQNVVKNVLHQQGLIQLEKFHCQPGSCSSCLHSFRN